MAFIVILSGDVKLAYVCGLALNSTKYKTFLNLEGKEGTLELIKS